MQLETVGEVVRVLRSRLGLEQVELARACGWRDASAVSRIETDRIHPTRRTLLKLAENLSKPDITGTPSEVRAWLFLAAGILPTARDVEDLGEKLPDISSWAHPASIMDFGWYLWRANELFATGLGLPAKHAGRHYLEMFFEEDGSVRKQFGDLWKDLAQITVSNFRADCEHRSDQRWFVKLRATLSRLPDFDRMWDSADASAESVMGWSSTSVDGGKVGGVRAQLKADPRFVVGQLMPDDEAGHELMLKYGAMLG